MARQYLLRGLFEGAVGTVFKVENKKSSSGREFKTLNISISEKPAKDKDYEVTWSGFVNYGGGLSEEQLMGQRVILQGVCVTTSKKGDNYYTNYSVNNLIPLGAVKKSDKPKAEEKPAESNSADDLVSDEDLPFF